MGRPRSRPRASRSSCWPRAHDPPSFCAPARDTRAMPVSLPVAFNEGDLLMARTVSNGYGAKHKNLRRRWARKVARGEESCRRCGRLIIPGTPWDLGHSDIDRSVYTGPEHGKCNRGTSAHRKAERERRARVCVDDPSRGLYWGPPDVSGNARPWSRAWFEWRAGEAGSD